MAQIMTVANGNNASEVAASRMFAAVLKLRMWEYEQASAAQMFSDRDQFAKLAAFSQGLLGQAKTRPPWPKSVSCRGTPWEAEE